jgi:hypothetical protein
MWAFPKGKPQLFSSSPRALGGGMRCYSFGRRIPRWQQSVLAAQPLVPVARRVFVTRVDAFEPVCGWERWRAWEQWLRRREARVARWVHLCSQWGKPRSSVLGLGRGAEPHVFVRIEPLDAAVLHPRSRAVTFRVPLLRDSTVSGSWLLRSFDAVPGLHRTPRWQPDRLYAVAQEAATVLETELVRPEGIPAHWRPMHGDFVPWNLREDRDGRLWLLDWEDAGWGPPFADLVRYAAAYQSIFDVHSRHIAEMIRQAFPTVPPEAMAEAATFWTSHRNLGQPDLKSEPSTSQTADVRRSQREYEGLRLIAGQSS